ncbi:MAG: putative peptidoglycan glycosyltransferase FtsW [Candidatus Lernaella stagnicola]|nr:putative peptidoglycan glycosyltransferase FtsW [Candidatus Lernaella stagnicola]
MTVDEAKRQTSPDRMLLAIVLALATWGLLTLFSVSQQLPNGPMYYLTRQAIYIALGMAMMLGLIQVDLSKINRPKVVYAILGVCVFLLLCVWIPGIGHKANGAYRWISVGPINLQPSEFTKAAIVIYYAHYLSKIGEKIRDPLYGVLPMAGVTAIFVALIAWEPDLGGAAVFCMLLFVMLFLAGVQKRFLAGVLGVGVLFVVSQIWLAPWRLRRLLAFLFPTDESLFGVNWQPWQAKIGIGVGGWFGAGYGNGWQKAFYVPEIHTDFILAHIGEELGLLGLLVLFGLFFVLIWRTIRITAKATDSFLRFLGIGAGTLIGIQVVINAAVVMSLLPNKGLSLPWFSAGGSNTLLNFILMGVILSAARHCEAEAIAQNRVIHVLARRELAGAAGD